MGHPNRTGRRWAGRILDGAIVEITVVVVVVGVAMHDRAAVAYWTWNFEQGSMFLSQFLARNEHLRPVPKEVLADRIVAFQAIRIQSDLSVGLAMLGLGLTAYNLRRSLGRRRAWMRPGAAAALAASAVLILWGMEQAVMGLGGAPGNLWNYPWDPFLNRWPLIEQRVGLAVLGTWTVLAACCRWHPRRTWNDRLGRVVGVLWLVQLLFRLATPALIPISNRRF